jgi:hypothetical protein
MIQLTQGKLALVDDEDYDWLNQWKWCFHDGYATRRNLKNTTLRMHRLIMDPPNGMDIDHANGNGIDNRRFNLRVCTRAQNVMNSIVRSDNKSGFRGVSWHKVQKKYVAYIYLTKFGKPKQMRLGNFYDAVDAAHAYDEAARQLFGEFARTNFDHMGFRLKG